MTEFKDYRETKEITLPKSGATVEVYDGLLAGDIANLPTTENEQSKVIDICTALIKDWDFEQDEKKVEVKRENVEKLHITDLYEIMQGIDLENLPHGGGRDTGDSR